MATVGGTYPSLIDAFKGSHEAEVIDMLMLSNPILEDAIAAECNMGAINRHTLLTGYPSVVWGKLYQGVAASKSTMQQVDDTTGYLQSRSEVAVDLLKLAPDPAKERLVASGPFFEKMNQEMATGLFYHDTATTPEKFKGLGARLSVYNSNTPVLTSPNIANQVIHGGGAGSDNTSIYFVTWAPHSCSLLYPKGTKAGVSMEDKGEEPVRDSTGATYYAKVATYDWHIGLMMKDYRYSARIANIDVSDLLAGSVDVWALLRKAYYRLHQNYPLGSRGGKTVIYMNRQVLEILDAQSTDRSLINSGGTYNYSAPGLDKVNVEGRIVRTYRDIPIRVCDAILNTEALVPSVAL